MADAYPAADFGGFSAHVGDLPDLQLGSEGSGSVTIDVDAAGWGWGSGGMSLKTAVRHEMGHYLGLGHSSGLMGSTLSPDESWPVDASNLPKPEPGAHAPTRAAPAPAPAAAPSPRRPTPRAARRATGTTSTDTTDAATGAAASRRHDDRGPGTHRRPTADPAADPAADPGPVRTRRRTRHVGPRRRRPTVTPDPTATSGATSDPATGADPTIDPLPAPDASGTPLPPAPTTADPTSSTTTSTGATSTTTPGTTGGTTTTGASTGNTAGTTTSTTTTSTTTATTPATALAWKAVGGVLTLDAGSLPLIGTITFDRGSNTVTFTPAGGGVAVVGSTVNISLVRVTAAPATTTSLRRPATGVFFAFDGGGGANTVRGPPRDTTWTISGR